MIKNFRGEAEEEWVTKKKVEITTTKERTTFIFVIFRKRCQKLMFKGSDQRENRGVWSNINIRYLVWRCGDGRSFVL